MRPTAGVFATALIVASLLLAAGCASQAQTSPQDGPVSGTEARRLVGSTPRLERTSVEPQGKTLSASVPEEDARGEALPGLPRPRGSVRASYSKEEADGLMLVRATYATQESPEAVRGFYRGVFQAEGWQVANVEYSGDGWHFLVLHGGLEAEVKVLSRDGGSEAKVELSGPDGGAQGSGASAGGSKR